MLLLCVVVAHSIAQEALQSVAVHTIATSRSLAGNQLGFCCSKVWGVWGMKREAIEERTGVKAIVAVGEEERIEKWKEGLMRPSKSIWEFSLHVKAGLMNRSFWHYWAKRDGISVAWEPSCISLPLSSLIPESSNIQTTLEETNPSAFFILLPRQKGLQSLQKASANCQGEITYCCLLRMNGPHSWCVIVI